MRSIRLAAGLFFLAPLVAEFLLGNLPITALSTLVVLAPLYGGGALLIREVVRRTGRGWPAIVVLGVAYGVLEEGIASMSLFNPNYAGERLLDSGFIPALGMGGPWTVFVLTLHAIWSISVPIAIMEVFAGERATRPWLGSVGLGVAALLFVAGLAASLAISIFTYHFVASVPQLAGTVVVAAALAAAGLTVGRPRRDSVGSAGSVGSAARRAPSPWLVGGAALLASSIFKELPRNTLGWIYVVVVLALAAGTWALVHRWSQQDGWGAAHRLALAAGAVCTYAWTAFPQQPMLPATPRQDLIGNVVFAAGAVALVAAAAWRLAHRTGSSPGLR